MDAVKDFFSSIREYVRDKTANPFWGAYVLAWVAVNFRLIVVLLASGEAAQKIAYIDDTLYPSLTVWLVRFWLGPMALAAFFVVASPFLQRWVTTFTRARDAETIRQLLRIEEQEPLTKEQADRLRKQLHDERARRMAEVDELKAENDELRQQLDSVARAQTLQKDEPDKGVVERTDTSPSSNQDSFKFRESDFISVPQRTMLKIVERGLRRKEAEALYVVRNKSLPRAAWAAELALKEHHEENVLLERLKGLELVEENPSPSGRGLSFIRITSAGSQALEAMAMRGFIGAA
ncbi:hypothetical protein ASF11_00955 [Acidovorax sp. Leaf76]|uniref:hypothetical protein n=1 Tax=unclassified Acidovorax TaxID=2684926 RepID=UPI0006FB5174|nr:MULTISPECIES: hypothetical protein [unclassified Acidovorax]KQO26315.1 hypothetical protein ASF11_00955 [Acidovorax sp. Leaf76]KQO35910.1 hypothetical protein ASF19_22760 [Acidovorax sp. Leaf84]KQS38335.1 hypothetical protein ASG27_23460 [Acidovorax sp. Leaf191]